MALPLPDLDDKSFEELVEEAKRLIPRYSPEWTDHNLHDPGITFIELFCWLCEMQLYYLNQLPEKNYLKYLRLLGLKPNPATPAKVDLALSSNTIVTVPKGTKLITKSGTEDITFETDEDIDLLPIELKKIVTYSNYKFTEVTEQNGQIGKFYYAFGENPEIGNTIYLGFNFKKEDRESLKGKEIKLKVYLYEKDLPPRGKHGTEEIVIYKSTALAWEYATGESKWEEFSSLRDDTYHLSTSNTISFYLPDDIEKFIIPHLEDEQGLFWIRAKLIKADYEIPPRIDTIQLNTVSATEGVTVKEEVLGNSSGLPDQKFSIENRPILAKSQIVYVDSEEWKEVDDFDGSRPDSNHYTLNRTKSEIVFGNGINGRIPPKDTEIKIDYRYGGGERGNICAEVDWQFSDTYGAFESIEEIKNIFPATGGKEEESIEDAILRARKELKIPYRAVTSEDFETITKATPGLSVARVGVQVLANENKVKVAVVPYSLSERPLPSGGFLRTVCEHLDRHRLITTQIEVIEPKYVKVSVNASVKIKLQSSPKLVRERIEETLDTFLHPLKGGAEGSGWEFGREVYKSEVYEVIEKVEGVDGVVNLSISKDGEIKDLTLVYPGSHRIEIISPQMVCKEESIHG